VNGVAVASERADLNVILFEGCDKLVELLFVSEKLCGIAVCLTGISAGTDLNGVNAKSRNDLESLVERLCAVKVSKYAEFHNKNLRKCINGVNSSDI
jgi:hypothetical protein